MICGHCYRPDPLHFTLRSFSAAVVAFSLCCCVGCNWAQKRVTQRAEQCEQFCHQSRTAQADGKCDRAQQLLDEAIRKNPKNLETRWQLAETMRSTGRTDAALSEYELLAAADSGDARYSLRIAEIQFAKKNYSQAYGAANDVLKRDSQSAEALFIKGAIEESRKQYDLALGSYQAACQIDPTHAASHFGSASVQIKRGQPDRAAPLLRAIANDPQTKPVDRAEALWRLGHCYRELHRWADAAVAFEDACSKMPKAKAADWTVAAEAQFKAGHTAKGHLLLNRAKALDPHCREAITLAETVDAVQQVSAGAQALNETSVSTAGFSARRRTADAPQPQAAKSSVQ